ncbi:low temperature requirement protein A [Bradyrhizobium betae]
MMAADNPRGAMLRVIVPNQHNRVTNVELFFDLVFVFAVTQVSHTLLHRFHGARRRCTSRGAVSRGVVGVGLHRTGSPTGSIPS